MKKKKIIIDEFYKFIIDDFIYVLNDDDAKEDDYVYYSGEQLNFPIGYYKVLDNVKEMMSVLSVGGFGIYHHISEEIMENGKKKIRGSYLKINYNIFMGENLGKIVATNNPELTTIQQLTDQEIVNIKQWKANEINFGAVVFYEPNYKEQSIIEINRTPIISYSDALYIYAETPNPASQIVKGATIEDVEEGLKTLEGQTKDPEWLKLLFDCI